MARLWANAILKLNRSQLKKRKIRELKDLLRETSRKSESEFKKVSPEELSIIKERIRNAAKKECRRQTKRYLVALIFSLLIIWFIVSLF